MKTKKFLKGIKLRQDLVNTLIGLTAVLVFGLIAVRYFSNNTENQTAPPVGTENTENEQVRTHIVEEGEDLWAIAEKYYNSGFRWSDIAEFNNIDDPNLIEAGQEIRLPELENLAEAVTPTISLVAQITTPATPTEIVVTVAPTDLSIETSTSTPSPTMTATPTPKPQITKQAVSTEVPEDRIYTVKEGDDLWNIAENFYKSGYNWVDIARENNIQNPYVITKDEKLVLPEVEAKAPTVAKTEEVKTEEIAGDTYKIQSGDNLWDIAVRAYGDGYKWVEIARENNLENPNIIIPDQELKLPR